MTDRAAARVASCILPGKVAGSGRHAAARHVEPTVPYPPDREDPATQQEVSGPVRPVLRSADPEAAIARIRRKPKPPAAYVFSRDPAVIDRVLGAVSFGGGGVNQTNIRCFVESLPFGGGASGGGASGMGRYDGKAGFDALSDARAMLIGDPDAALDLFPPYAGKDIDGMLRIFG